MAEKKKTTEKVLAFFDTFSYCIALSWRTSPFYTIVRISCDILPSFTVLATAYLGKRLLDLLAGTQQGDDSAQALVLIFSYMLCLAIAKHLVQKLSQYSQRMHDDMMRSEISLQLMDKGISVDLECFDNSEFHNKLLAASRDSYELIYTLWNVMSFVSSLVAFAAAFFILCGANVLYGLLMIAAAVPSSIAGVQYTKRLYRLTLSQIEGERQKMYINNLTLAKEYAQNIRLFNAGGGLKRKYTQLWKRLFDERKKTVKLRSLISGLLECLPEIVIVLVGIDISFKVLSGYATVGDYSLYNGLVAQLWSSIFMLSSSITQIYDNQQKISNYKSLDKIKSRIPNAGTRRLDSIDTIEFRDVTFAYPGTSRTVLKGVNFDVSKCEKVALVGLNGSGKSTLIKLLLRLYDVDCGAILINGHDIKEYPLADVRRQYSMYFQDEQNFSFTLRDNISIADEENADDEKVAYAFEESGGGDILEIAPNGLDTYLTRLFFKDGMELSGGQHQKVALARTFFRRHTALVLDEPSSNLDPKAEHDLFEKLREFTAGKTTLFTSHRLSNVFLADKIVVLEAGKVIEIGTQNELLKNPGRYAELFQYQKEKFEVSNEI